MNYNGICCCRIDQFFCFILRRARKVELIHPVVYSYVYHGSAVLDIRSEMIYISDTLRRCPLKKGKWVYRKKKI